MTRDGRVYTLAGLKVERIERHHGGVDVEITITGLDGKSAIFGMDADRARRLADEIRRLAEREETTLAGAIREAALRAARWRP